MNYIARPKNAALYLGLAVGMLGLLIHTSSGAAETPKPSLAIEAKAMPTAITSSAGNSIAVVATNRGGLSTNGEPLTVVDELPPGVIVEEVDAFEEPHEHSAHCEFTNASAPAVAIATCTFEGLSLSPYNTAGLDMAITVRAESGVAGTLTNTASISGGGTTTATEADSMAVGAQQLPFGLNDGFSSELVDEGGAIDSQAGAHPSADTTAFVMNSESDAFQGEGARMIAFHDIQDLKDVVVTLPVGLVGDPQVTPTCPQYLVAPPNDGLQCPGDTVIGSVADVGESPIWEFSGDVTSSHETKPLFNIPPEKGHPAQFAFIFLNQEATLYPGVVDTPQGYTISVASRDVPRVNLSAIKVTFFGDPGATNGSGAEHKPFFTNPSDCAGGPLATTMRYDSWEASGAVLPSGFPDIGDPNWKEAVSEAPPLKGCEDLIFAPELEVAPTSSKPDSPSGITADLRIPQNSNPEGLATPDLKDLTVTLPRGLVISPSSANGLQACGNEQIAFGSTEPATCPEASVVGTVTARSPLLADALHGRIFVGAPECGPCSPTDAVSGRLVRLFVEIANPQRGVDVKLEGKVSISAATGQLIAHFDNSPQLPVEELQTEFKQGERAPLATPATCGTYTTTSELEPWSHQPAPGEGHGTPTATVSSSFAIAGCGSGQFAPAFSGGTTSNQAGSYGTFTLAFSRRDGEQEFNSLEARLPQGLLAKLDGVPLCDDAEAAAGTCPEGSRIGVVTAEAGPGADPYSVTGGVYLTSSYNGGPFGEVTEIPAIAGPFNLGTVVVRGAIRIDPATAQASVISDPFPKMLDGIPLQVRSVNVTLDRPEFTFNPTSCDALRLSGVLSSTIGTSTAVSSRFQAAGCAGLKFNPSFSVSTSGKTSKADGVSLKVDLSYPQSGEANIHSVRVELPKAMPSRLTTLQKACTEAEFDTNPATCPAASVVGHAKAITPILPVPLEGPAYFVSHGGAAFPELIMVLQGDGVVIDLNGETFINKAGVTSSTFAQIPDAPVSSFELTLPEEPNSALAANGNLCDQKLIMPTTIGAQNAARITQNTRIAVEGCSSTLSVVSSAVNKRTLKLTVFAPGAGRLTASGKGVSSGSKSYSGTEAQTFTLNQKEAGKLKTKIKLTFIPIAGKERSKRQIKVVAVRFKK
jgi:hypothetical protein